MSGRQKHRQLKTEPGMVVGFLVGIMLCLFLAVLLTAQLMAQRLTLSAAYLEDALACSNLAGAVVDLKEYGFSHDVVLQEPEEAYNTFLRALRVNLDLDENMHSKNQILILDEVKVDEFIIYNVRGAEIEIIRFSPCGVQRSAGYPGRTMTPNGQLVEKTGIYSEVSYQIRGYFGEVYHARKGKLVDVVAERS